MIALSENSEFQKHQDVPVVELMNCYLYGVANHGLEGWRIGRHDYILIANPQFNERLPSKSDMIAVTILDLLNVIL